ERALQIAPDLEDVLYNLAGVFEAEGAKDEAERTYARLLARNPELEGAWFQMGYLRLEKCDYRGAVEAFQHCVFRKHDWSEAQFNLALSAWQAGDRDAAAKAFQAVLGLEPNSVDALRGLAALAVEREQWEQALDYQAKLIELGERSPELFYNTGLLLQKSGQVEDAVKLYREALVERPDFAEALLNLGHALKSQGNQDEARKCWKQAVSVKPELATGYFQ